MLRTRRYRIFAVFAFFFVVAIYHFSTYPEWEEASAEVIEGLKHPGGLLNKVPSLGGHSAQDSNDGNKPAVVSTISATSTTTSSSAAPLPPIPTEKPEPAVGDFGEFGLHGLGRHEVPPNLSDKPEIHWTRLAEHFPVPDEMVISLPTQAPVSIPKIQYAFTDESSSAKADRQKKQEMIKDAFKHSWSGYKTHAWLQDELSPVSGGSRNPFCEWAATLVDSLDTLWIMGLESEFKEAVDAVKEIDFTTSPRKDIPVFETTIRYLGGLISAYDISGQKYQTLLDKAIELGDVLYGAFDTPNRMPILYYYWRPTFAINPHRAGTRVVMAEIGSLAVEFTRLAQLTKDNKYYDAIARITNELEDYQDKTKIPGLWPKQLDASGCKKPERNSGVEFGSGIEQTPIQLDIGSSSSTETTAIASATAGSALRDSTDSVSHRKRQIDTEDIASSSSPESDPQQIIEQNPSPEKVDCEPQGLASPPNSYFETFSLGGEADSTFEYLPKQYMLLGGLEPKYKKMYEKVIEAAEKHLLYRPMVPDGRDILAAGAVEAQRLNSGEIDLKLDHELTHLTCFVGGMWAIGGKIFDRKKDIETAAKLAEGCVWAYEATSTGIMPESMKLIPCPSREHCPWNQTMWYEELDPWRESREMQQTRTAEAEALMRAHGAADMISTPSSTSSATSATATEVEEAAEVGIVTTPLGNRKRQLGGVENDDKLSSLKPHLDEDIDKNTSIGEMQSMSQFPTHEEYVQSRIKDEHIPEGIPLITGKKYILRPEAIESVFIMYRVTGDEKWREKGWRMFEAIQRHCLSQYGYSAIGDVTDPEPYQLDEMESFWLAETLKYFYLLFSTPDVVSLDEYVLNTEAHPMKRPR